MRVVLCVAVLVAITACRDKRPPTSSANNPEIVATSSVASPSASATASASTPAPSASAAPSKSVPATWLEAAGRAPERLATAAKDEYAKKSLYRHDDAINDVLNRMAAQPATASGLQAAAKILEDNDTAGVDMRWAGSGAPPSAQLLRAAGLALLADLVTRACASRPSAEISHAIDSIPLPAIYDDGHRRSEWQDRRARDDLHDAAKRCPR